MFNRPQLPGSTRPDNSPSTPSNTNEALALVRAGRLQEATDVLMGNTMGPTGATTQAPPVSPQTMQRWSNLAARGFAGVQDVFDTRDVKPGQAPSAPARTNRSAPNTHATVPGASEPGLFERVDFTHNGASHPYALYTPKTAAPAGGRPLVMMLHGCTQDANNFARGTRMNAAAEAAGALVLYPTQSQSANANGCWNWFRPEDQLAGAGEPALLLAMVRHAEVAQAVDGQRIYVAGLSAGGAMAAVLAHQYPQAFAAVGVHSGLAPGAASTMMGALSAMKSGAKGWSASSVNGGVRAVPMIILHGDADRTVHQRNGEQLLQGAANGVTATVQTQEQSVSPDGQRYTRTRVIDPAVSGTVVAEHWLLHGAGHAWSGGDARGSYANAHGVKASDEMLRFFLTHRRPGTAPGG